MANRTRQPGASEEGEGALSLAKIREIAAEGRCTDATKNGTCLPRTPKDKWGLPDEDPYADAPEVDDLRFIVGIVDGIEVVGR